MTSPARLQRQARDRTISIVLAVLVGLVVGVGGWLVWQRQEVLFSSGKTPADLPLRPVLLLPHKALYGVSMVSARNGSQIIDIGGKMFFQMQQGCESYVTDHRFVLTYDYADSEPMRVTSDFSTVESKEGTQFDFSSRRRREGELYQELRGRAELAAGQQGKATYGQPENLSFELAAGTLFPAAHTRALIQAARSGKKFLSSRIFDGSDEEGPVDVAAVIGDKFDGLSTLTLGPGLSREALTTSAWKVRLAFFPSKTQSDTADYELSMILHENGVISDMTIDYQDFSVHQRLLALEALAPEACGFGKETGTSGGVSKPPADPVPDRPLR